MKAAQLVKTPYEEIVFDFDFSAELDPGESVLANPPPVITFTPPTTPDLVIADMVTVSPRVQAKYKAGKGGTRYHVTCQVTTTNQKRELCGELYVEPC